MKTYFKIFICFFFLITAGTKAWSQKSKSQNPMEMAMENLDKSLNLDNFQKAAIQAFLQQNQEETNQIIALNKLDSEKREMIKESRQKLSDQIKTVLSAEQIEIFDNLNNKKTKNKKKKKSD